MFILRNRLEIIALSILLIFINAKSFSQTTTSFYTEDTSDFPNPERGFFHQWISDSKSPSPLVKYNFDLLRQDKMTMIRRTYNMTTFRSTLISNSFLQHIQSDMDAVRSNGMKLILRFAYTFNESPPNNDAPLNIVLSHIDQLAPILQKNYDVIAYMEAGFIGRWGEWHTSINHLDNTSNKRIILQKILAALPKERTVAVRTQQAKKDIYNYQAALTPFDGFNETDRARTAHHNDCFCAAIDDWGTYWPIDTASLNMQKNYLQDENRFLPQGGETCNQNPPRSDCSQAVADLIRMRWSTLNADYESNVLYGWLGQGCYNDIKLNLGYRFRLVQTTIPNIVNAGSDLSLSFIIHNNGYATTYNPRSLEVVLRAKSTGIVTRLLTNVDPRQWLPENGDISVNVVVNVPSNLSIGEYDVLLNMPDPASLLNSKKEYSIRLANKNIWEDSTGYNSLLQSVIVKGSTDVNTIQMSKNQIENIKVYPNPTSETTNISYTLGENVTIKIDLFDALGINIMQIENNNKNSGNYHKKINLERIATGVYFLKLSADNEQHISRIMLLKR